MSCSVYQQFSLPRWPGTQPVPVGWEVRRLKFAATCNDEALSETTDPDYEMAYVDISSVNLINGITAIETLPFEKAPSRARRIVRDGDAIISTVRTYLKAIAAIEEPPKNMIVSTGFAVVRPLEFIDSRFLGYALQGTGFIDAVVANSTGVSYPAINPATLVCLPFGYPVDKNEQQQIAAFLDWKTEQIDALIGKKKELLEKLKEKRIAVITQAVTQGLNPDVPMRDSGIPWLGQVPQHWEVKRGRFVMLVNPPAPRLRYLNPEEEVSFIPMEAVGVLGGLNLEHTRVIEDVTSGYTEFQDGDVIVAKITPCFENGKAALASGLANGAAYGTTELHVLRANINLDRRFLFYVAISDIFLKLGESEMYGAGGQKRVPPEFPKDFRMTVPPLAEQESIADYLDAEMARLDALVSKVKDVVGRLQEYRTALITAATTGKIDVCKVKIPNQGV
jgi:type I restriction enzyme S subunit